MGLRETGGGKEPRSAGKRRHGGCGFPSGNGCRAENNGHGGGRRNGIRRRRNGSDDGRGDGSDGRNTQSAGDAGGRGETEPAKAAAAQGNVIAYGAVVFDGEPAYDAIEGAWLTDGEYVVLHRMAVADGEKGRGVATEFMRRVEAMACGRGTGSMRVDTNFDNRYMLRMLGRLGFVYCGKVRYRSGERLAFEKTLGT